MIDSRSRAPARKPNAVLRLKRKAPGPPPAARLKAVLRDHLLRIGRKFLAAARRWARKLDAVARPNNLVSYTPRQISRADIIEDISAAAGFDYAAERSRITNYESYYSFVPASSIEFHLARRRNHVDLAALRADVVLFPSSHPLLFLPDERTFIYDKHHEIPYHWRTDFLYLSAFSFANTARPSFALDTNIYDIANVFEIPEEVIYLGGSFNYGHFFTDYFPRFEALIAAVKADPALAERLPRIVVVYCEKSELDYLEKNFPDYAFLNLRGHEFSVIHIPKMYLATYVAFPLGVHLLRRGFADRRRAALGPGGARSTPAVPSARKVFLTRQGFKRRRIENEDDLIAALQTRGYLCISAMDYSVEQLAEILDGAETLVAGMGGHTTNAVFLRPGSTFIELAPASFDSNHIWQYNHSLFLCAQLKYLRFVVADSQRSGRGAETADAGIFDWEGVVDVKEFVEYVDRLDELAAPEASEQAADLDDDDPPQPLVTGATQLLH